jgi:2-hydroxychromene-2-carboxylate isomerase
MDFWFSIGSTYSYLSVMRLDRVEQETGVVFNWRPFNVREIMLEMDNIPFRTKPLKLACMWRDIERRANWASSERRHSRSTARSSGATTG